MVIAGVELIENFQPILLVFAGILIFSRTSSSARRARKRRT